MPIETSFALFYFATYLAIGAVFTVWVGRTLHTNGRIFLLDVFSSAEFADAVNQLLIVGFYLINAGYIVMNLGRGRGINSPVDMIERLSVTVGGVIILLGVMHFFNLYVFSRIRRSKSIRSAPPPVKPSAFIAVPADVKA